MALVTLVIQQDDNEEGSVEIKLFCEPPVKNDEDATQPVAVIAGLHALNAAVEYLSDGDDNAVKQKVVE